MAATALSVKEFSASELEDELEAANADGNNVANYTGKEWFEFFNDDATESTVTFNSQKPSNYGTDVDLAVSIPAGERRKVKLPAPASRWRDTAGAVQFTYSKVTDLSAGAFRWPE